MQYNQSNFEKTLTTGASVLVRWSNSGTQLSGLATVAKMNKASIVVELSSQVGSFPIGHKITVPRSCSGRWTYRECVLPPNMTKQPA